MEYSKKDIAFIALYGAGALFLLVAVGSVTLAVVQYYMAGNFTFADLSFLLVLGLFIPSALYVRTHWKQRATFIAIGENRQVVAPVNRRDEFIDA